MSSLGLSGRSLAGIILAVLGGLLLLTALGIGGEEGMMRWFPSLFILLGLWGVVRNGFRNATAAYIMLGVGLVVQLALVFDDFDSEIVWAIVLIAIGVALLAGGTRSRRRHKGPKVEFAQFDTSTTTDSFIKISNVMSSGKQTVESQEFGGGEVNAVMGSVELDLRDARIAIKPARMEIAAVMGSVNLKVPSDWNIAIDNSVLMGSTEDNRSRGDSRTGEVDLLITGSVVMGGIEIDD